jgi:demethylmenaquinone methyltransferase/2-methoxy-6-polyprenyl-1,4-benzoquinol methylase
LDVGCGTGLLFDCVKESANLIVGLDLSRALLEIAAERCKNVHRESPIHLIRADADYMPVPKEIFEKVFALTLLQNLPDPSKTLREMMRVAEAGSMMVVTGLKKCFSEEGLRNILNVAGLDSSTATGKQTQDIIAVCRRVHNTKDE